MIIWAPRTKPSLMWMIAAPLLATLLAAIFAALLLGSQGLPVLDSLHAFFVQPLSDPYARLEVLGKATPILLCALGLAACYRAGIWNIGAEGQFIVGAICGSAVALQAESSPALVSIPLVLLAGMLGGAIWSGLAAWLKTAFEANEILTTIMLNYVAIHALAYAVNDPLRDPSGFGFPESALFADTVMLPSLLTHNYLSAGVLVAVLLTFAFWGLQRYSRLFYHLKLMGAEPRSLDLCGTSSQRLTWLALLLSGACAGLAAMVELLGPVGQLTNAVSFGYGYTAIIVAFLGRLHPVGMLFGSLLLALTYLGGENLQIAYDVPKAATSAFQGLLLLILLSCDYMNRYTATWFRPDQQVAT